MAAEKIRQVQLVGRKIRELRKEHKLTQVELSSRLGIQQSDLSRMEKGEYRVSLDTLFRILAEFKLSIGEFFEGVAQESITPRDVQLAAYNIARHYELTKNYKKSLFYARIALDRARVLGRREWLASTHNLIGNTLLAESHIDPACHEYEEALELAPREPTVARGQI